MKNVKPPTFHLERALVAKGHLVIGVDEVGCGCLAGPVIAAAVHIPLNSRICEIHDSKLLRAEKREEVFTRLLEHGVRFTIGMATASEVDFLNVRRATYLAMKRAINAYEEALFAAKHKAIPQLFALVDAWTVPGISISQRGIIHGDRLVKSIAAASIIAKVVRDRLMREYENEYPGYFFSRHKGYGTALHYKQLRKHGPSPLHRKSFLKKL